MLWKWERAWCEEPTKPGSLDSAIFALLSSFWIFYFSSMICQAGLFPCYSCYFVRNNGLYSFVMFVQVLPEMMKLLAQLVLQLPKDGQNMVLNELYTLVSESDDVTRKPSLVSWLQSLSYLCSQSTATKETCTVVPKSTNSLGSQNVAARLWLIKVCFFVQ